MQILPFIFSFLLFFSISLTYLFDGLQDSSFLKSSLSGYFEASLTLENAKQEQLYKAIKKTKKEKPEEEQNKNKILEETKLSDQKTDKNKPASSTDKAPSANKSIAKKTDKEKNKNYRRIYVCSQLNIYPLMKDGKQKQPELFLLFKR